jgi:hypothetical protein
MATSPNDGFLVVLNNAKPYDEGPGLKNYAALSSFKTIRYASSKDVQIKL